MGQAVLNRLGRRIVMRRAELQMTQRKLAAECGVARSYIGVIEGGQAPGLSVALMVQLCLALRVTPDDLLAWELGAGR
jgi:transcriptional regulator with XRE-family HTH domain